VEIKYNFIKIRKEDTSRKKVYIPKNIIPHQKTIMNMYVIMIKKKSYSLP